MDTKPKKVVVVGGSLAGLMHAIVLSEFGHDVHILEQKTEAELDREAAGLSAGPDMQAFINRFVKDPKAYSIAIDTITVLDEEGRTDVQFKPPTPGRYTTWTELYRMFRETLANNVRGNTVLYETSKFVSKTHRNNGGLKVTYRDCQDQTIHEVQGDMVIGTHGGRSGARISLVPDSIPQYAGYVLWRGVVREKLVSDETKEFLANRMVMARTKDGYSLSYYVPPENREQKDIDCGIFWAWYRMMPRDTPTFQKMMTDDKGKRYLTTVPRGKVQASVVSQLRDEGQQALHPAMLELLEKSKEPFVSVISDCSAPQAVFHNGKILLAGDAFCLLRPHTGAGANQAARQALRLADVLEGKIRLKEWESEALEHARIDREFCLAFVDFCFSGRIDEVRLPAIARAKLAAASASRIKIEEDNTEPSG